MGSNSDIDKKSSSKSQQADPQSMPSGIAEHLRELIARGTLPPGLQLKQTDLAARFSSSRVPLREALKQICAEGLVEHDPNRGFFVAALSRDEARQLYRMRHFIELELMRTLQWPNKSDLATLRGHLKSLDAALREQDEFQWLTAHRAFYETLFGLSPEKYMVTEALRLMRLTDRYRALAPHTLPREKRRATQEKHLLELLGKQDRKTLLKKFKEDRTKVETDIMLALQGRGL